VLGEDRLCEGDKGKALAAHSTLNRLELGVLGGDALYKKIIARPQEIEALLIEEGIKAIPRKSREIILDFDATDDPFAWPPGRSFLPRLLPQLLLSATLLLLWQCPALGATARRQARCQQRHGGGARENRLRHPEALWAQGAHHCASRQRIRP
jgi:hypothetical protein